MSGPFDFLADLAPYAEAPAAIARLNNRHRLLIDPFAPQIAGARVLDLGAHDGRWSCALARAGAAEVVGVEARRGLIDRFAAFPDTDGAATRVRPVCNDLFAELQARADAGECFDVVALFGIFYHVMDHFRLLGLVRRLSPQLVVIDSEFIEADNAVIQVLREAVDNPLNAVTDVPGRVETVVGVPSRRATEFIAAAQGFDLVWLDHAMLLGDNREGMQDYFRNGRKRRHVCALTPAAR